MAAKSDTGVIFTASSGVLFHDQGVHFTRDGLSGLYSFTAPDAATAQKIRDLAAAEPQWGIAEVTP